VKAAKEIFAKQADAAVARLGPGPYAMGDRFTGADILLTTCLTGAKRREITLAKPLNDYLARTTSREAFQRAMQSNQLPAAP
jgi:glutathione S-transferase